VEHINELLHVVVLGIVHGVSYCLLTNQTVGAGICTPSNTATGCAGSVQNPRHLEPSSTSTPLSTCDYLHFCTTRVREALVYAGADILPTYASSSASTSTLPIRSATNPSSSTSAHFPCGRSPCPPGLPIPYR